MNWFEVFAYALAGLVIFGVVFVTVLALGEALVSRWENRRWR